MSGSINRTATISYDGHGRLKTRKRPEQNANTATVYNYNGDDSIQWVVDARGTSVNYSYNSRGLVEQISSTVPSGSFGYDNIGNRTSMQDGLGTVSYNYNQLTDETRAFADNLPSAPLAGNAFKLEYDYTLAGQLKSLKDPFGQQFNHAYDKVGRLNSVAGATAFGGITTYASNPQYNARGTLTALHYGNVAEMAITGFSDKLQATDFEVKNGATSIIKKQYQFYGDGSLKFSKDVLDARFDRLYKYDNVGRTVQAKSGVEAKGGTDQNLTNIPYNFQYGYHRFGQITNITDRYYGTDNNIGYTFDDGSGRGAGETYDAEDNVVSDGDADYVFDAAGRSVSTTERDSDTTELLAPTVSAFDGDGEMVERIRSYTANTNNARLIITFAPAY